MPRVKPWSMAAPMRLLTPLALAIATLGLAACGEKDEPDVNASEPPVPQADSGFDIIGTWKGTLQQKGLKPFRVTATIRSLDNDRRNPVSYTGIDCAGSWTFEGLYTNSSVPDDASETYTFREVIDRGAGGTCKGAGTVSLTPTPTGRLDYAFAGGGIESRGVLSRAG
jgi:hypothetical protein